MDERAAAAAVAARTPYPLHVIEVGRPPAATLAADVSAFLDGLDEPVVSTSVYAQWCVMRAARDADKRLLIEVSKHLERVRDHSLDLRRYYRVMDY